MNPVGMTDTGRRRKNNEDAFFVSGNAFYGLPNLFIVADGMGGHNAGEVASAEAIKFFRQYCEINPATQPEILDYLIAGCAYANNAVYDMAENNDEYYGMGTTFTVCVKGDGRLYIAHIGDSRAYAVYENKLKLLTTDHTYVCEMQKFGQITDEEARTHPNRNMLTKVLGVEKDAQFDGLLFDLRDVKKILLCSDGLTTMLDDAEIFALCGGDNEKIAQNLIDQANHRGGADNVTLIAFDS